jgi:UDP-N-acetylmuramyl tripeptide synthase
MMKRSFKFYIAIVLAKLSKSVLKILGRNASYFPGNLALKICPDFLGQVEKPKLIIGVTGTNGKTTVSNMINDILENNGYKVINNRYGSNMNTGIAASFIANTTFLGKNKNDIAVFEMDERSTIHIFKYITPTYLICNNLSRDSIKRNAHTAFIANIINNAIPKETTVITNGDDPICVNLARDNKKIYYGIDKLDTDTKECENIVQDMVLCPKCGSKLEYEYYRYHHVGKMHCPNCDFKTPKKDYEITKIDYDNKQILLKDNKNIEHEYTMIVDGLINI